MAYRFRAHIYWNNDPGSMYHSPGHAQWASEQVEQRLTMAFHLLEGAINEERTEYGSEDGYEWTCNVFVPDESQAILEDFFAHILAESSRMITKVIEPEEGETEYLASWMDIHHCFNGINQPCEQPYMVFQTEIPEPPSENPCDAIPEWDANEGYTNMEIGDLRKVEVEGFWKVYAVKDLGFVHYDPSGPNGHYGWTYQYDCPN